MRIHTVQLNLGDLMGGTSRMDGTEFGAYLLLFLNCYQDSTHELPAESETLRRIARVSPKVWKRIEAVVMRKFTKTESGWRHDRVDEEIKKMLGKSAKNTANIRKRWDSHNTNVIPQKNKVVSNPNNENDTTQEPEPKIQNPKNQYTPDFEKFWFAWPIERRCEKPKAFTAWKESLRKCPADRLLECQRRYLDTKQAKEGFFPYPARWLKNERWLEMMDESDGLAAEELTIDDLGDTPENREFLTILETLKEEFGVAVFRSWLSPLRVLSREGGQLVLGVPTRFMGEWIRTHYHSRVTAAVKKTWPEVQVMKLKVINKTENLG